MLCQSVGKGENDSCDDHHFHDSRSKTLYLIALLYLIHSSLDLDKNIDRCCQNTGKDTGHIQGTTSEEIRYVAVSTAAKQIYKGCTVLNGYCHTIQYNIA